MAYHQMSPKCAVQITLNDKLNNSRIAMQVKGGSWVMRLLAHANASAFFVA